MFIFVTDFGIVCLDCMSFYRNDVTRSARHILMNMQKVEQTGDKVDLTGNIVAGSFNLDKSIDFCRKSLPYSTMSPVCTRVKVLLGKLKTTLLAALP